MEITGWTEVALVIPMNSTAAYMAPIALNMSCWVSLVIIQRQNCAKFRLPVK
jgi:hypothetical protein